MFSIQTWDVKVEYRRGLLNAEWSEFSHHNSYWGIVVVMGWPCIWLGNRTHAFSAVKYTTLSLNKSFSVKRSKGTLNWKQQRRYCWLSLDSIPVTQIKTNKIWHIDITNYPAEIMHHRAIECQRPEHELDAASAATAANAHQRREIAWFAIFGGWKRKRAIKKDSPHYDFVKWLCWAIPMLT